MNNKYALLFRLWRRKDRYIRAPMERAKRLATKKGFFFSFVFLQRRKTEKAGFCSRFLPSKSKRRFA